MARRGEDALSSLRASLQQPQGVAQVRHRVGVLMRASGAAAGIRASIHAPRLAAGRGARTAGLLASARPLDNLGASILVLLHTPAALHLGGRQLQGPRHGRVRCSRGLWGRAAQGELGRQVSASLALTMLLLVKRYLREAYALGADRIAAFNPGTRLPARHAVIVKCHAVLRQPRGPCMLRCHMPQHTHLCAG